MLFFVFDKVFDIQEIRLEREKTADFDRVIYLQFFTNLAVCTEHEVISSVFILQLNISQFSYIEDPKELFEVLNAVLIRDRASSSISMLALSSSDIESLGRFRSKILGYPFGCVSLMISAVDSGLSEDALSERDSKSEISLLSLWLAMLV